MKFPNPLGAPKPDKPPAQREKPKKSQEELRTNLETRMMSLEPTLRQGMKEYEQSLKDGTFEDQEGEEEGAGEGRKEAMQKKLTALMDRAERMKEKLDSKEPLPEIERELSIPYTYKNPETQAVERQETITLNIEEKLKDFLSFYQKTHIDLTDDFEDTILDIWQRNQEEMTEAILENGFDELLVIPPTLSLTDLSEKMKMEQGYWESSSFKEGGSFSGAKSPNTSKPRLILVHKAQNLKDRPELKQTLNIQGQDVNPDQALSLEDYLIFQRKYFEETTHHLDEVGWTWLSTKSGAHLVFSSWAPGIHRLAVLVDDPGGRRGDLGLRSTRCFF